MAGLVQTVLRRAFGLDKTYLPPSSRFSACLGWFYAVVGLSMFAMPNFVNSLLLSNQRVLEEPFGMAIFQMTGLLAMVIGYFYITGGLSGSEEFLCASIVDRLTFVPLCTYVLWARLGWVIASIPGILDPVAALITLYLYHQEKKKGSSKRS